MQTDNFSEKRAKIWFSPNILQIAIQKNTWKTANTVHSRTNALFDYKLTGIQNCQNESHRPPSDNLRNFGRIKCLSKRQKLQFLFSYAVTLDKFHSCAVGHMNVCFSNLWTYQGWCILWMYPRVTIDFHMVSHRLVAENSLCQINWFR